jgi:hypothetical protein
MKKITLGVLLVAVVSLCTSTSNAQFRLSIEPVTGMNFNIHTGSDLSATGTGFGFVIGGRAVMSFTPMIGLVSGLTFYDNRSGSYSQSGPSQAYNNATQTTDASVSLAYLMFENLFLLKLPNTGLFFVAGPVVGFNVEGSGERTTKHVSNADPTQSVTDPKVKASIKDLLARFELKLGSGYDIPVSKNIFITPQVTFGFGITKVISDVSYRILTFQLVTGVKFVLI